MQLTINSQTNAKYTLENKGGREYLITRMMPIVGDSVMNALLYPNKVVASSYGQLDKLPAPAGHPVFNGEAVSALDPEGGAAFSIGAFVRNPTLNGTRVTAELAIDTAVAARTDQGRDVVNRIKRGDKLGVSTGLNGKIEQSSGTHQGHDYYGILNSIRFDHVALLLNEAPAGDSTYTLNSGRHFQDITRGRAMRTVEIDTEALSLEDHIMLQNAGKWPDDMIRKLRATATLSEAESIVTNSGKQILDAPKHLFESFIENRDHLATWMATQADKRQEKVEFVVENSDMTADDLATMSDDALDNLCNSVKPRNVHIAAFNTGGKPVELDLSILEA